MSEKTKAKLKILIFGRYDFNELKGGVQYYSNLLAQSLSQESGVEIDLLVSSITRKKSVERNGRLRKIVVPSYGHFQSVPVSPGIIFKAWRLYFTSRYDGIHLNFPDPLAMLACLFIPWRAKIIVTWHSDVIRQKWALRFYLPVLKFFMRRVSKVIVATPSHIESCEQLKMCLPSKNELAEKVCVLPFAIDTAKWMLTEKVTSRVQEIRSQFSSKFLLFSLGRHVYYKGFEYLLEAMVDMPDCYLVLAGQGPLTESLKSTANRLNLNERVSFAGLLSESDLTAYMHACDVFCFPSVDTTEAYGYAQLEAMACGKPVVSSDLKNGVSFVNRHNETGLLVPPRDPKALVAAILTLQKDSNLREKLGQNGYQRVTSELSLESMTKESLNIYQELQ